MKTNKNINGLKFECVGVLIFYFNINRAKKYEEEVIEFIDGLLNKNNA